MCVFCVWSYVDTPQKHLSMAACTSSVQEVACVCVQAAVGADLDIGLACQAKIGNSSIPL